MNCKPGDLAIVVKSRLKEGEIHIGKIVTCVRMYDHESWEVKEHLFVRGWLSSAVFMDAHLRPIRDNPGNESFFKAAPQPQSRAAELLS